MTCRIHRRHRPLRRAGKSFEIPPGNAVHHRHHARLRPDHRRQLRQKRWQRLRLGRQKYEILHAEHRRIARLKPDRRRPRHMHARLAQVVQPGPACDQAHSVASLCEPGGQKATHCTYPSHAEARHSSGPQDGEVRCSFLKKRTKRLLCPCSCNVAGHGRRVGSRGEIKVFCFFSSEKKTFLIASRPGLRCVVRPRSGRWSLPQALQC